MLLSLYFWFSCFILYFFYKIDTVNTVYNTIQTRYQRWQDLNNILIGKENNRLRILLDCCKLMLQILYVSFLQYINTSVIKIGKNKYEVSYVVNGKLYKFFTKPTKGPCPILQISDQDDTEVTENILPYMGPNYDWCNTELTPSKLSYDSLSFILSNGESYSFSKNQPIRLSQK